jgi:hypothetical protein
VQQSAAGFGYAYALTPPVAPATAWTRTILHTFRGAGDGARPGNLTMGRGRVLYGVTAEGGTASNAGTVFMIEP